MADNRTVEQVSQDLKNFIGPQRPNKNQYSRKHAWCRY